MLKLVARVALLVIVVIAGLGVIRGESVADMIILFVFGGVVPGTDVTVPDELILGAAAATLTVITRRVHRSYMADRIKMRSLMPRYDSGKEDPSYSAIVPGLAKAIAASQTARARADSMSPHLRVWLRHFGPRPYVRTAPHIRTAAARETIRYAAMRFDRWGTGGISHRQYERYMFVSLGRLAGKLRAYMVRATMF